jgi:hypothetical protein
MLRKGFVLMMMGTVIFFLGSFSSADVPHMINYQGKLTTAAGGCLNDTVEMAFSIYPDTLGSAADWSETQTEVVVKEGIFNVLLGAVDTIPSAVFDGNIKYLGVQVESDPEMRPLKPIVSVAYAYRAGAVNCSDCDDRFVNVEGPDSVFVSSSRAFLGRSSGSHSSSNIGIEGWAKNSNGPAYGGYFVVDSSATATEANSGIRVNGYGASDQITYGAHVTARNYSSGHVYGGAFSAFGDGSGEHFGLLAAAYGSSSASAHGSYGSAYSTSTGAAYGIQGEAMNSSSGQAIGGHFYVHEAGSGSKYGVLAIAPVLNGYAGYFQGRVMVTDALTVLGDKSAAVKVDNGEYRLLYSQESPENWFEDFGEGRLADGKTVIQIDPLFAQTVNTSVKYHVFLTPQDEPLTLAVANKTATSFEVIGPAGANISFSYRIVAKRKGYENIRLAKMGGPTPEQVAAEQERARMEQERMQMEKEGELR